jgi:hypothetical protein
MAIIRDGERLARAPAAVARSGAGAIGCLAIIALLAITAIVAHFQFGLGAWLAVLLAPVLLLLLTVLILATVWVIAAPFYFGRRWKLNARAQALLASIHTGAHDRPIVLFLRPFDPQRGWMVRVAISKDPTKSGIQLFENEFTRFDLDGWVGELASPETKILKVSDRIDAEGGSVRLDAATWQQEVLTLIRAAHGILFLPGVAPGILWEATQIKAEARLDITTIIMPYGDVPDGHERLLWERFQAEYGNLGFQLPPYDPAGMLIHLTAGGACSRTMPIINSTRDECRRFIARGHVAFDRPGR